MRAQKSRQKAVLTPMGETPDVMPAGHVLRPRTRAAPSRSVGAKWTAANFAERVVPMGLNVSLLGVGCKLGYHLIAGGATGNFAGLGESAVLGAALGIMKVADMWMRATD